MRRSWYRPVVQFAAVDRPPTIAGHLTVVAIRSRSSTVWRRWLAARPSRVVPLTAPCQAASTHHRPSSALREFDDPMHWIVEPNALAYGVGEDRAEECHGAPSDTTTATYDRETAWLGLLPDGCLAGSDIVHEAFNIVSPDRIDRYTPKQWNDVRAMRPRSEISADSVLAIFRRVSSRPASTSARYWPHNSATVVALRPAILSARGSAPLTTSPRTRRASLTGCVGPPGCLPIV